MLASTSTFPISTSTSSTLTSPKAFEDTDLSMNRKQLKKPRFLGPARPLDSAQGPSQAITHNVASIAATSNSAPQRAFARMTRMFHPSSQSHQCSITAETANTSADGGTQEQREQPLTPETQDVQVPPNNSETGPVRAEVGGHVDTTVEPLDNTVEGVGDSVNSANTTSGPVPALVSSEIDATQEALDSMVPIPYIDQPAIGFVANADAVAISGQGFSDRYLQPLKTFSSVATTIAKVHPYAQIALGILTTAAQVLIKQANLDSEVSSLFDTIKAVYAISYRRRYHPEY
ncbi:hypothetical protein EV401DRAFT_1289090 [Pisolithus croceorrhizus]|nr:hypothetical protein EV401DRAFT_1289090 [Pisolithus croceorrhizus]